ncbi:sodium:proton antiporter [Campylobacter corcagiensis]|nr:Na+/H+ antiporter NhaA [Campylobacter corcagiensis]QKF63940.1 sodium:proton antiporter [Campylobacter corcagiensis]
MAFKFKEFISSESGGGMLLLGCAFLALIFVNTPGLSAFYDWFIHFKLELGVVLNEGLGLKENVHFWINDFLMAFFFFSVGLELKKEMKEGQLKYLSQVVLPIFAAIGGVITPALIFALLNWGGQPDIRGWAIPTATDIAFAVGVLALLGRRIPASLKIFVLTLAIMDDLCAIVIIALFYSGNLSFLFLGLAFLIVLALIGLNLAGVSKKTPYIILSLILWFFVLNSGIHASIAGVVAAFTIPLYNDDKSSMLKDLEHILANPVNFIILPLFAFTNAGVSLIGLEPSHIFGSVPMGIFLGLFLGKQIGIFLFSFIAIKMGFGFMPERANWKQLYAVAIICGIGFTMSLFVDNLAYGEASMSLYHGADKLAILVGSFVSGVVGYFFAKAVGNNPDGTPKA